MSSKRRLKPRARSCSRARSVAHSIYLSDEESAAFRAKAAARGSTLSDLVRHWIGLQPRKRKPASEPAAADDPRQVKLSDVLQHEDDISAAADGLRLTNYDRAALRTAFPDLHSKKDPVS